MRVFSSRNSWFFKSSKLQRPGVFPHVVFWFGGARVLITLETLTQETIEDEPLESANVNRILTLEEKYHKAIMLKHEGIKQTEICTALNLDDRTYQRVIKLTRKEAHKFFETTLEAKKEQTLLGKIEKSSQYKNYIKRNNGSKAPFVIFVRCGRSILK